MTRTAMVSATRLRVREVPVASCLEPLDAIGDRVAMDAEARGGLGEAWGGKHRRERVESLPLGVLATHEDRREQLTRPRAPSGRLRTLPSSR